MPAEKVKDTFLGERDGFLYYRADGLGTYRIPKSEVNPDADLGFPQSGSFSRSYQPVTGAKYKRTPGVTESELYGNELRPEKSRYDAGKKRKGKLRQAGDIAGWTTMSLFLVLGIVNRFDKTDRPRKSQSDMSYHGQRSPDRMAKHVIRAMASQDPYKEMMKLGNIYGKAPLIDGMVAATVGISAGPGTGLDGVSYEKYLKVLTEQTGKDFYGAYKDKNPQELMDVLYNNTVNPAFMNDPRIAALIIGGQAIERMTGNDAYTRHVKLLEEANLGGVSQFKREHGRYPDARELDKAMRHNVMNENTDPEKSGSSTVSSWYDPYSRQSGETTTYGSPATPNGVAERQKMIDERQRSNLQRFGNDADEAKAAIDHMLHDQFLRTQEKKGNRN